MVAGLIMVGLVMGVLPLGIGVFMLVQARRSSLLWTRLMGEGVKLQAHVTSKSSSSGGRGSGAPYSITYRYDYQGKTYSGGQTVGMGYYNGCDKGTPIFIRCLPSKPAISHLEGEFGETVNIFMGVFLVFMGIVALTLLIGAYVSVPPHP